MRSSTTLLALALAALPPGSATLPAQATKGALAVGATIRDSLTARDVLLPTDSTYAQQWRLSGIAGETVTIDLVSDAFDGYAFLLGPGLSGQAPHDDDSGGHCNARLTVRLPETGDYFVVVTSTNKLATGPFVLSVVAGPKPKSLTRCDR